jgi:hypothetical protein
MKSARREKQDNMQELFGKKNKKRILFKTGRGNKKQMERYLVGKRKWEIKR